MYREIAEQLRSLIAAGEIAAGERLPAERELSIQLGVSRPTVREALIALDVEGWIDIRVGAGIFARKPPSAPVAGSPVLGDVESPLEILRARQVIESELAATAAQTMQPAQVAGLREAIAAMQADASAGRTPTAGDRLFHLRIAEASTNSVLIRMSAQLLDERCNPMFERLGTHFENARNWDAAIAEHRAVADAIERRIASEARAAMALHLDNAYERFTATWPLEAG